MCLRNIGTCLQYHTTLILNRPTSTSHILDCRISYDERGGMPSCLIAFFFFVFRCLYYIFLYISVKMSIRFS
jgi:hypothetical protein